MDTVRLLPGMDRRVKQGHLWIFSNEISDFDKTIPAGHDVRVLDEKDRLLGSGTFNPKTLIAVRLHALFEEHPLDAGLLSKRMHDAWKTRELLLGGTGARACRLVNAEGDFLPGLVVDRYDEYLSLQRLTAAMDQRSDWVLEILRDLLRPTGIVVRNDASGRTLEGLGEEGPVAEGNVPARVTFSLHGLEFSVDLVAGQKTGFYFDQASNYSLIQAASKGARVLDAFCYTGAWGIHAAVWGAEEVLGIDNSSSALEIAQENARRNHLSQLRFERADVLESLKDFSRRANPFDLIILDPPAYARSRQKVQEALAGHLNLHKWALRCLKPGGILVACCCSSYVSPEDFLGSIIFGARQAGRRVRILASRGQGPDHPWIPAMEQTAYLKVHLLQVL